MNNYRDTDRGFDTGAVETIFLVGAVLAFIAAIASCLLRRDCQQENQRVDRDGNLVVLDGARLALSVSRVQSSSSSDGGGGGGGGGCGGD